MRLFINLQSSRLDSLALASERFHAIFTIRSLQFAVLTPVVWRKWSDLGGGSCNRIILNWRGPYFLLIVKAQLCIGFHHRILSKGILGSLLWLHVCNVMYKMYVDLRD
jgi:hypothetical protein